ncbi:MAG: integrase core domain-containing protein [Solirubrobacteraceae bacterium]
MQLQRTNRRDRTREVASLASSIRWIARRCGQRRAVADQFETLDQAREVIANYIEHYHDRPHSRLNYRTPREVRKTWDDAEVAIQKQAA